MVEPLKIAILGRGAIAKYVFDQIKDNSCVNIAAILCRPAAPNNSSRFTQDICPVITTVEDLPSGIEMIADCSGHSGLAEHGAKILAAGIDIITISTGALSDPEFATSLSDAAKIGNSRLKLLSGAIAGIDAISAGSVGKLHSVNYIGRKPPAGWVGSPAEKICDLKNLTSPVTHFTGTAREAARLYPKNANVAATVGLAGVGMDETKVELIADPGITKNTHEVTAVGEFGKLQLKIEGAPLATNPKSSALAAMSIVNEIRQRILCTGF